MQTTFGYWKEYGEGYNDCPSVKQYVNPERNRQYDKEKLINYLNTAPAFVATSAMGFASPFDGSRKSGSLCVKTDGKRQWLDNINDFILHNNLVIPEDWYQEIVANNFIVPDFDLNAFIASILPKDN